MEVLNFKSYHYSLLYFTSENKIKEIIINCIYKIDKIIIVIIIHILDIGYFIYNHFILYINEYTSNQNVGLNKNNNNN